MRLILILLISLNLSANVKDKMLGLYQNEKYKEVCNKGFNNFSHIKHDENYISLYAFSCLKSDFIDRLSVPIAMLKYSPEARANSAYFSIILMQKKLLYHSLIDEYALTKLNLPTTDYILSKVFDFYVKLGKHDKRLFYLFEDTKNKKLTYKLYILKDAGLSKIIIEEFYDTISINRHVYW